MNQAKWYYSLKYKGGNSYHKNGVSDIFTGRTIYIGETADCDIRFENDGFEPELYATIIRNPDDKSWCIVKNSCHVDINISGKGSIGYVSQLNNGDIIHFAEKQMSLLFNTHYDCNYLKTYKSNHNRTLWITVTVLCAAFFSIFFWKYSDRENTLNEQDVAEFETYIYQISVDSVKFVKVYKENKQRIEEETKILTDSFPRGTAFLTTDGYFVTARHCVEYWIGEKFDLTVNPENLPKDDICRWAIEAESLKMACEDSISCSIIVFCSIYDFLGNKIFNFTSTDTNVVFTNIEHDGLFQLADFDHEYYWRTIRPYFNDMSMSLGDIIIIKAPGIDGKGAIKLGDKEDLKASLRGTDLVMCGFPVTEGNRNNVIFAKGVVKQDCNDSTIILMEADINHGFSGAPVLKKTKDGIVAIGVVSKVDSTSGGLYKWAVPVTEIQKLKK